MHDAPTTPVRCFPKTRWSLILAAQDGSSERRAALEELLSIYWRPLYLYARRKGLAVPAAEDAVQGFCLHILEGDFLAHLDRDRGRFRGYLRRSLDNYLVNQHAKDAALKRGGGVRIVPFDPEFAERTLAGASEAPDAAFDREWAFTLMERCLAQLRREYSEGARRGADAVLRFFRLQAPPSYADAAKEAGMLVPQFKAALHRARARFRELVRAEIAETLDDAADLDHEMSELLRLLDR